MKRPNKSRKYQRRSIPGGLGYYRRQTERTKPPAHDAQPKPRILPAGYPVPISLDEVDACIAKLSSMKEFDLAALADALIKRRPVCNDSTLRAGYTRILQAIRRVAIAAGPAAIAAIGNDLYFKWPSTLYYGLGAPLAIDWNRDGPLKCFGYCVGMGSPLNSEQRRGILSHVFAAEFPDTVPDDVRKKWGAPKSPQRMSKIAQALAYLAKNAKGRTDADLSEAICDWESDLDYLRRKYYVGVFGFG